MTTEQASVDFVVHISLMEGDDGNVTHTQEQEFSEIALTLGNRRV